MRRLALVSLLAFSAAPLLAQMPTPPGAVKGGPGLVVIPGPASEVLTSYNRIKSNVIKAAEEMPEGDYQFRPYPDIRTYARVVNHVTEAQFRTCGILNGTATAAISKPPSDTADKATIVAGLKASFAECDKAYGAATNDNIAEFFSAGPVKRTRIGMLWGNYGHDDEQYALLSMYLRIKGLTPPTVEK